MLEHKRPTHGPMGIGLGVVISLMGCATGDHAALELALAGQVRHSHLAIFGRWEIAPHSGQEDHISHIVLFNQFFEHA